MANDSMNPMNVGAPQLIPDGNIKSKSPGSFGEMQKAYYAASCSPNVFKSRTSANPSFVPGYQMSGFDKSEWQTMTRSDVAK